jgi:hypothetical protein
MAPLGFVLLLLAVLLAYPTLHASDARNPLWLELLIAKCSLEPQPGQPYEIWRYRYRGADAYYVPPRCCDVPSVVFDANGTFLGAPSGGLSGRGDGQLRDFPTTGGTLIWRSDRNTQGPVAARAILQDPRFSKEVTLLTFARLEVDTDVAWEGGDPMVRWPSMLRAGTAPLGSVSDGASRESLAMDFVVRYKDLFGMVDPASELVSAPVDRSFPRTVRFVQKVRGVAVLCCDTNVDFNEHSSVIEVQSGYRRDVRSVDTRTTLDSAAAMEAVRAAALRERPTLKVAQVEPPTLEINACTENGQGAEKLWYSGIIRFEGGDAAAREGNYVVDARSRVVTLYL